MNYLSVLISEPVPAEAISVQQKSYVTYTLSALTKNPDITPTITLLEARTILAASGTVGLRTWEAALFFGNYLLQNPSLIEGKSILELGAGTGYLSILCSKYMGASHVLATDG
jgi:protein-L-isoaspartate O-methyltransferase